MASDSILVEGVELGHDSARIAAQLRNAHMFIARSALEDRSLAFGMIHTSWTAGPSSTRAA
jgi:hypothetical protein